MPVAHHTEETVIACIEMANLNMKKLREFKDFTFLTRGEIRRRGSSDILPPRRIRTQDTRVSERRRKKICI